MKLPDKIKGKNKIRDAAIVLEFKQNRTPYNLIAEKFKLTERRILQILSTNHAFIKIDKEWEKEKRIARLEKWLNDSKNKDTRKDPLEIQQELRKEIEGDGVQVDASKHLHQTYVWLNHPSITNTVLPTELSDRNTQSSSEI